MILKHLTLIFSAVMLLTGLASANTGDSFGGGHIVRLHGADSNINGTGALVGVHQYGNRLNMVILATEHTARRMGTMQRVGFGDAGLFIGLPGGEAIDIPLHESIASVRTVRYGANGTTDVSLIGLTIDLNRCPHPVPLFLPEFGPGPLAVAPAAGFTFACFTFGTDGAAYPGFGFRNKFSNVADSIAPFTGSYTTGSANNPLTYTQTLCQWDFDTAGGVPGEGAVGAGGAGSPLVVNGSIVGIQVTGSTDPNGVSTGVVFDAADVTWLNSKIDELLAGGGDLSFLATSPGAMPAGLDPNDGALTPAFSPGIFNYTQATFDTHLTCFPIKLEPGSTLESRINGVNGGAYFTVDAKPPISTGGIASGTHSWAIRADGSVASWGHPDAGSAGVPANLTNVKEISVGGDHGIVLFNDGTVSSWGGYFNQQIQFPRIPVGLTGISQICAGSDHIFLLDKGCVLKGYGPYVTERPLVPIPADVTDVVAVATGTSHVLALKRDGTVAAWGGGGGLGWQGEVFNVPAGLNNVVAIAASDHYSMALKRDGNVVVWGDNSFDQNQIPTFLQGPIVAIAAADRHVIVLYKDGTIGGWGSTIAILPHKNFTFPSDVTGITCSYNTFLARHADGSVTGWGFNGYGAADPPAGLTTARSSATPKMALNPGLNTVEFKVTPASGRYAQTYTLNVTRRVYARPTIISLTATPTDTTATVSALVYPGGQSVGVEVQFGTDPDAFNRISAFHIIPQSFSNQSVVIPLSGLEPGTQYFYRIRAGNGVGPTFSPVMSFTTVLPRVPTISSLVTQEVLKHGISPWLDFTVGPGPYAGEITVTATATSINLNLLQVAGIEFDGAATGAARRVRLNPVCGQTGTAVVTLTATLDALTATTTFTVNVVDRPPAEAAQIVGLGSLPSFGGGEESSGQLISADGNVVVGRSVSRTFRWTTAGGIEDLHMFSGSETNGIKPTGISSDGTSIAGHNYYGPSVDPLAYLWTWNTGYYQELPTRFQLNGLSGDGAVFVGHLNNPNPPSFSNTPDQPVRWTQANGIENLGKGGMTTQVSATNISSDGSTIVGYYGDYYPGFYFGASTYACYWSGLFELRSLDSLPGGQHARANAASADGGVIVGYSDSGAQPGVPKAVRWVRVAFTNQYVVHELDNSLSSIATVATAVSANGSRIVGTVGGGFISGTAFVWDAENGQRPLQTALVHGGASVNADWASLEEANGISADGIYIVGTGTRASFQKEAFRAKLPLLPPTPTISAIADVTTLSNTSPQIPFTLTDADSNPVCLGVSFALSNLTLLPVQNVVISGTGANRTLTVTPAAGQTGQVMIVLMVSDGFSSSEEEFIVNVVSADSLDGWRLTNFGSASSTGNGALTADPDGDGRTNLEEFAFGMNPNLGLGGPVTYLNGVLNQRGSPVPVITGPPGNQQTLAVFCRRTNWQAVGLTYTVLFSRDMLNKVPSATLPTVLATDGEIEVVAIPYPATIEVGGQPVVPQFFQVRISRDP